MGAVKRRAWVSGIAVTVSLSVFVSGIGVPDDLAQPASAASDPASNTTDKPVPGRVTRKAEPTAGAEDRRDALRATKPQWPHEGATDITLTPSAKGVAGIPVKIRRTSDGANAGEDVAVGADQKVHVEVLPQNDVKKARGTGLAIRLSRADGKTSPLDTRVTLDYSGFRWAHGGGWADRLQLVKLPACVLTADAKDSRCDRQGVVVPAENDVKQGTLTADVEVSAAAAGTVYTLAAAASGPASGDFSATDLRPQGSWEVGLQSGGFTYSYPLDDPPSVAGSGPGLSLSYDSSRIDGMTKVTNNQASWVGEGWDLSVGYVERRYRPCASDAGSGKNPKQKGWGDLCWESPEENDGDSATDDATASDLFINLGGQASRLLKTPTGYKTEQDFGWKIEKLTGGDQGGEYWKITTQQGQVFRLGYRADSVWRVPYVGDDAGEPCHDQYNYSSTVAPTCTGVWRWNLDETQDSHENVTDYYWTKESNNYTVSGGVNRTYDRGGYLDRIEWGANTQVSGSHPTSKIVFNSDSRVIGLDSDIPDDLVCSPAPGGGPVSCEFPNNAPTFFISAKLAAVDTYAWNDTIAGWDNVSRLTLTHQYVYTEGDSPTPVLWLDSISQTGLIGDDTHAITLPAQNFNAVMLSNRVDTGRMPDGEVNPAVKMPRIGSIVNGFGGQTAITYSQLHPCVTGYKATLIAWDENDTDCYPVYDGRDVFARPRFAVYRKHIVTKVTEEDLVGGSPDMVTTYEYDGTPAWAKEINYNTRADHLSWSEFRGYGTVRTIKGSGADPDGFTVTSTQFFRGMYDDTYADGSKKQVTLTDYDGNRWNDQDSLVGQALESRIWRFTTPNPLNTAPDVRGMAEAESTRYVYWQQNTGDGPGVMDPRMVRPSEEITREALADGTYRKTATKTVYDSYGLSTRIVDSGQVGVDSDDTCTTIGYARNTANGQWMIAFPSVEEKREGTDCAGRVLSRQVTLYDGGSDPATNTPTDGNPTEARSWRDTDHFSTVKMAYDSYGRPTSSTNTLGKTTTVTYNPVVNWPGNGITVTNPLNQSVTTWKSPLNGGVVGIRDLNGRDTNVDYDALGRTTAVWTAPLPRSGGTPAAKFAYEITGTGPAKVTSQRLLSGTGETAKWSTAYSYLDGFGRDLEAQETSPAGGRIVQVTKYDARGLVAAASDPIYNTGDAGSGLLNPTWSSIPSWTGNVFDGLGRQVAQVDNSYGSELRRTRTNYYGDHHEVIPPSGGKVVYFTDLEDRVTKIEEWVGTAAQQTLRATENASSPTSGPKAPEATASGSPVDSSETHPSAKPISKPPTATQAERALAAPAARQALKDAAKQGRQVLVDAATTETSLTYADPDGKTFTTQIAAGPVRVRQGDTWVPVETTLVEKSGELAPKAAKADVRFSTGGHGAFARMTRDDGTVFALSWPTALPRPEAKGNTATYADAAGPGADLVVTALATGFRHDIVLRQRPDGPVEYRLPVDTSGLTLDTTDVGTLTLTDKKGKVVAAAPKPFMWAATGASTPNAVSGERRPPRKGTIRSKVVRENGRQVLVLQPDRDFLADPATRYPVTIDPTTTLPLTTDTSAIKGSTSSHAGDTELPAGAFDFSGISELSRAYLKFNTSALAGATVSSATLQAYQSGVSYFFFCSSTSGIIAARVTASWDPATLTWTNKPATTTADQATATEAGNCAGGRYMSWTITSIAQAWASGTANNGIELRGSSESAGTAYEVYFEASEAGAGHPPTLTVTYTVPSAPAVGALTVTPSTQGPGTRITSSLTPALHATVSDSVGGTLKADYEVEHDPAYTSEGTGLIWSGSSANVTSGADAPVTVPSGKLTDGWHLRWRARAANVGASTTSAWSAWQSATVTVPDPVTDQLQVSPSTTNGSQITVTSATPVLAARVTDPSGAPSRVEFEIEHDPADTAHGSGQIWTGGVNNVASGSMASATVSAGKLSDGWRVRWRVRAVGAGSNTSAWTSWQSFDVALPRPSVAQLQVTPSQSVNGTTATSSLTPQLLATVNDPAGASLRAEFEVEHDPADTDHGTGQIWTGSVDNAASGSQVGMTVPDGKLSDGWKVRWRARAVNTSQSLSSDWSPWQNLTVGIPKPSAGQPQTIPSADVGGRTVTSTLTPVLRATVTDPGGGSLRAEYEIEHDPAAPGDQGTGQIWTGSADNVASGSSASVTVSAGTLTDGWRVRWRVRAVNAATSAVSDWSDWQAVTVAVPTGGTQAGIDLLQVSPSSLLDGVTVTSSSTPTLLGRAFDPDGGALRAEFELEHDPADTAHGSGQIWTGAADNVATGAQAAVSVPGGKLADGWLVRWRARVVTSGASGTASAWSDWRQLKVDVPDPVTSQLQVTPSQTSGGTTVTSSLSPALHATVTDPNGGTMRAEFELEHDPAHTENGTGQIWTGAVDGITSGADAAVTVPTGKLNDGWVVRWRVRAVAAAATSDWSPWQTFTVTVPKATIGQLQVTPSETSGGTTVTPSLTPVLHATPNDPEGGALKVEFEVEHDPADTAHGSGQIWTGSADQVASGADASVTVASGKLADGWQVRWRARAAAASSTSPWSGWQTFTVDLPDPTVGALGVTPSSSGGTVTSSLTPALSATVTGPAGGTLRAEFEVEHDPAVPGQGTGQIWAGGVDDVDSGTSASATVPAGKLADGWKVRWHARAVAPNGNSAWSAWQSLTVTLPQGGPTHHDTTYEYDIQGRLTKVTDANGNVKTFTYDWLGQRLSSHDPDAGDSSNVYDDAGRLVTATDAKGQKISYSYDDLDRRTAQWVGDAGTGTKVAEWTYDTLIKGQLTSSTRWTDGQPYTSAVTGYDAAYHPLGTKVTLPSSEGALAGDYTFTAGYGTSGRVETVGVPAVAGLPAETLTYGYTGLGDAYSLTSDFGGGFTYVKSTAYDPTGDMTERLYGADGQVKRTLGWDVGTGNLTNITTTAKAGTGTVVAQNDDYFYDINDNVNRIVDKVATIDGATGSQSECFTYDDLERLTSAWTTSASGCSSGMASADGKGPDPYSVSYSYDPLGNLSQVVSSGKISTYHYPTSGANAVRPNAVTSISHSDGPTDTYTYDDNGALSSRHVGSTTTTLDWDEFGRLTKAVVDGQATENVYSASGERIIRREGGKTTLYLGSMEVELANSALTAKRYYASGDGATVAVRTSGVGAVTWLVADPHGSSQLAIDDATGNVSRQRYLPFGAHRGGRDDISVTDRGFLGKTEDSSTDLVLLDARFYDPSIGKFLSPDPILELSEPQLANPYGYAGNNPETFADPTGLSVRCPSWLPAALCTMLNSIPQWAIDGFFGAVRSFLENNTAVIAAQLALQAFGVGGPLDWMSQLEGIFGVNRNSTAYKVGSVAATIISWAGVGGVMNLLGKGLKEGAEFLSKRLAAQQAEKLAARKAAQKAAARRAEAAAAASERRAAAAARRKARAEAKATSKATRSRGGTHKSSASTRGGSKSRSGSRCSFPPGTLVLMADGSRRPIEQLKVGDKVLATDPVTSAEGAHAVTATTGYKADKHMVEISIKPKSAKAGNGDTITATDNHPFWVQNRHAWLQAGQLQPGMWLRTSAGTQLRISAIKTWTSEQQEVHNLTIDHLPTYHVLAGDTPILAHNCPSKKPGFFKRHFGKKETGPAPAPNARVADLRNLESDGSYSAAKAEDLRGLDDDELVAAARHTEPPDVMYVYEGGNVIGNGNHRMRELLRRADDPKSDITDDTAIFIRGFGG
ncbi:DNRLRE domain-containing protein [Microbispora triticiradicis]|uniref:DNRLRE domain-containing protein n=1 Tax=Microbispora triticiradicis TaxID=2200763 RepID=UPI0010590D5E|nr:DNRLRE domain-containing protein [Microbispora triticiradicis]